MCFPSNILYSDLRYNHLPSSDCLKLSQTLLHHILEKVLLREEHVSEQVFCYIHTMCDFIKDLQEIEYGNVPDSSFKHVPPFHCRLFISLQPPWHQPPNLFIALFLKSYSPWPSPPYFPCVEQHTWKSSGALLLRSTGDRYMER